MTLLLGLTGLFVLPTKASAQGPFVLEEQVTPWQDQLNQAQRLRGEAAIIGKYRGDGSGGYVGGCAGEAEKSQIRSKLEQAISIGEQIRDVYGQAEQGQYVVDVSRLA